MNIEIKGNGTSLWGESNGLFLVKEINLNYKDNESTPAWCEIQMFGDNIDWYQYTDRLIEKEVNEKCLDFCISLLPEKVRTEKWKLIWSEQGMQPANGWSFDFFSK